MRHDIAELPLYTFFNYRIVRCVHICNANVLHYDICKKKEILSSLLPICDARRHTQNESCDDVFVLIERNQN